jgi:hypothetical protein
MYQSDEEVEKGDRVLFHGDPGYVELIADPDVKDDPETEWHVHEHGGGILLVVPKTFGRVFLPAYVFTEHDSNYDDLQLVSRVEAGSEPLN